MDDLGVLTPLFSGKKNKCLSHLPPLVPRLKAFDFITHFASVMAVDGCCMGKKNPPRLRPTTVWRWGLPPKNGGFPQQTHGKFLLQRINTWGVKWGGTTIFWTHPYLNPVTNGINGSQPQLVSLLDFIITTVGLEYCWTKS